MLGLIATLIAVFGSLAAAVVIGYVHFFTDKDYDGEHLVMLGILIVVLLFLCAVGVGMAESNYNYQLMREARLI